MKNKDKDEELRIRDKFGLALIVMFAVTSALVIVIVFLTLVGNYSFSYYFTDSYYVKVWIFSLLSSFTFGYLVVEFSVFLSKLVNKNERQ